MTDKENSYKVPLSLFLIFLTLAIINSYFSLHIFLGITAIFITIALIAKYKSLKTYLLYPASLIIFFLILILAKSLAGISSLGSEFYLFSSYNTFHIAWYLYLVFMVAFFNLCLNLPGISKISARPLYIKLIILLFITLAFSALYDVKKPSYVLSINRKDWLIDKSTKDQVEDDIKVFKFIEAMKKDFDLKNKDYAYPKILLPNIYDDRKKEIWIFPMGSIKIMPYYDVFPLAFFGSHIDWDYLPQNYFKYVCSDFNLGWLKERNIKYLFLPSYDEGGGCLYERDKIIKAKKILYRSNNSYFIELF